MGGLVAGAMGLTLAACGSGSNGNTTEGAGDKGGTITVLDISNAYSGTDPAAVYLGEEIAQFRRLVYRALVAFPISKDDKESGTPIADMATDTGTPSDDAKTWTFTIKDGLKWQDGQPITAADFAYGLSRSFDPNLVHGTGVGTTYLAQYNLGGLFKADGSSAYPGPLTATPAQQALFDKAVVVKGNTITYHFSNPVPDFPLQVAALFTFDPYEKSFDHGTKNLWTINSDGPYMLQGDKFNSGRGGTFVRNPNYDPSTDNPKLRAALPDQFDFEFLSNLGAIFDRLVANTGKDQTALSFANVDTPHYADMADLSDRSIQTTSPYTRYVFVNALTVTNPKVRRALQVAADKAGYIKAEGGSHWGTPTSTLVSSGIPGYVENPATKDDNPAGDPAAAAALLKEAGVKTPYPITFGYSDSSTQNEQAAAAMQAAWNKAGFKVTLMGVSPDANPDYYTIMSGRDKKVDVFMGGWAADWPSMLAVIPPILKSNPPGAQNGVGFNYGFYSNKQVDSYIQQAQQTTSQDEQISLMQKADATAAADGAYIPLANQNNWFLYGSKVGGFLPDVASSYYPDLGSVYVAK
ncbi:ABC transporter substrate-binding protein [Nocardioides ultimimeridianus]